jgi:hypothetical protein
VFEQAAVGVGAAVVVVPSNVFGGGETLYRFWTSCDTPARVSVTVSIEITVVVDVHVLPEPEQAITPVPVQVAQSLLQ